MKKVVVAAIVVAGVSVSGAAKADVSLFDVNQQSLDASLAMRRSTTEQVAPIRGQSVLDRPRPDYDPVPIALGSFQLFPALNLGTYYDSNIFATSNSSLDDQIYKVNPTVTLASNWGRHALSITGLGDFNYYSNNDEQNYKAGAVQVEGRYDVANMEWLSGAANYQRVVEMRGGLNAPGNSIGPSEYHLLSGNAEAYRGPGQLKLKADLDTSYYDYDRLPAIGGGTINQDARNRTQSRATGQVGYDMSENFRPYVKGDYDVRNYTKGGPNSSRGYAVDVGSKLDLGGIVTGEVYAGYLAQDYINYNHGTVDAIDFGADFLWNITGLTSIEAKAGRSVEETTQSGASSVLASQGSVQLSHELRRDLVVQATAIYYALDYQKSIRRDDLYDLGTGARYYINRHLYGDLSYDFQRRDSNFVGNDYDRHVAFVRIGVQY